MPPQDTPQTVLVSGSGRGIGAAIARRFGLDGWQVVVNYRERADAAEATARAVTDAGGHAITARADVSDPADAVRLVEECINEFGELNVLVNAAHRPFVLQSLNAAAWSDVQSQFDGTFGPAFHCVRAAVPFLRKAKPAAIVNVSSVTATVPESAFFARDLAKAALDQFTRRLALELAPHVRVNGVAPGWTMTEQLESVPAEQLAARKNEIPLRRFADPEEIAECVYFLASTRASYVTGVVLHAAGGYGLGIVHE